MTGRILLDDPLIERLRVMAASAAHPHYAVQINMCELEKLLDEAADEIERLMEVRR